MKTIESLFLAFFRPQWVWKMFGVDTVHGPHKHRTFSSTENSDNERAFNTVRAHLFKWPDPFTPSWIGAIMSQGASDAGRNSTAHCTIRNLTRARAWEEADCGQALTGGENARAQGLFSRASLTRNVTLLNLELGLFSPLSVELIFRCLDTFTVKWVTSKSKQK